MRTNAPRCTITHLIVWNPLQNEADMEKALAI